MKQSSWIAVLALLFALSIWSACENKEENGDDNGPPTSDDDSINCPAGQHDEEGVCVPDSCGDGRWGDLEHTAATLYVWAGYGGSDSDGSAERPFKSIPEAVAAAANNMKIAVAEGAYPQKIFIGHDLENLIIEGRCPELVQVVGDGTETMIEASGPVGLTISGITVKNSFLGMHVTAASSTVIKNNTFIDNILTAVYFEGGETNTITGNQIQGTKSESNGSGTLQSFTGGSVFLTSTESAEISGNQITDGERQGIRVQLTHDVAISDNTVDSSTNAGISLVNSNGVISRNTIINTIPDSEKPYLGMGIWLTDCGETTISENIVEDNSFNGIYTINTPAQISHNQVRRTKMTSDGLHGEGIGVTSQSSGIYQVTISQNEVEENHGVGIIVNYVGGEVSGNNVTNTQPYGSGDRGYGIGIGYCDSIVVADNVLTLNSSVGLQIGGSICEARGNSITQTQPDGNGEHGHGLEVTDGSQITIHENNVISDSTGCGLVIDSSSGVIDNNTIKNTQALPDGNFGYGIQISNVTDLTLTNNTVTENTTFGIIADHSTVTLDNNQVTETAASPTNGLGRGIQIQLSSVATLTGNTILNNFNAGVCFVQSEGDLQGNTISETKQAAGFSSDGGDGLALFAQSFVNATNNTILNNIRCGILFDYSSGDVSQNEIAFSQWGALIQNGSDVDIDDILGQNNLHDDATPAQESMTRLVEVIDAAIQLQTAAGIQNSQDLVGQL